MKRKNLIFQVVSLFAIVGLIAVGCQKNDNPEASVKKFTLGFDVQQPDVSAKKAIDNENIPQYYGSKCKWDNAAYVVVGYSVKDVNKNILVASTTDTLRILEYFTGGGVATELLQVEFTNDEATTATLTVESFIVHDADDDAIMATPLDDSAFDGYVEESLSLDINIAQYTKERKLLEVLCFQPDDYLEFGFTWFDFDIVVGKEYCAFFNCIGSTAGTYHSAYNSNYKVYEVDEFDKDGAPVYDETDLYFEGNTMNVANPANASDEEYTTSCIPVPGSYFDAVGEGSIDNNNDNTIVMIIKMDKTGVEIPVTVGDISSYNFGEFPGLAPIPTFIKNHNKLGYEGFDYEIVGNDGENIVHYQLDVCTTED